MLKREDQPNTLIDFVYKHDLDRKKSSLFKKIDSLSDFPKFELDDVKDITLGSYQMK